MSFFFTKLLKAVLTDAESITGVIAHSNAACRKIITITALSVRLNLMELRNLYFLSIFLSRSSCVSSLSAPPGSLPVSPLWL